MVKFRLAGDDAVPVLDAATILLLRNASDGGIEVLMMLRNVKSDFVGGAYVFPGGAVDPEDVEVAAALPSDARHESQPVACVAGLREAFEEAGMLVASHTDGSWADRRRIEDWDEERDRLNDREAPNTFGAWLRRHELTLRTDQCCYVSRWVTPRGAPRRYDTRFFAMVAPPDQEASPDETELTAARWIRPTDALEGHRSGELTLIFPTARTLMELAEFTSVEEFLENVQIRAEPVSETPTLAVEGERVLVVLEDGRRFDSDTAEPV